MSRRALLVSKGWVQAVLLVVLFGFFVLGLLAYRTYQVKRVTLDLLGGCLAAVSPSALGPGKAPPS